MFFHFTFTALMYLTSRNGEPELYNKIMILHETHMARCVDWFSHE